MTDINIWNSSLSPSLVAAWMSCTTVEETDLTRGLLVNWRTADWLSFGVSVETRERREVCYREREERLYMFRSDLEHCSGHRFRSS